MNVHHMNPKVVRIIRFLIGQASLEIHEPSLQGNAQIIMIFVRGPFWARLFLLIYDAASRYVFMHQASQLRDSQAGQFGQ